MKNIPTEKEMMQALEQKTGKEIFEKFRKATVAICGLGGLGSNVSISLSRAGVGKLILTDFDRVDITNLHRQQYFALQIGEYKTEAMLENLQKIAPYTQYEIHTLRLDESNISEVVKDADIVCEAFDNPQAKAMLVNFVLEKFPEKFVVSASGMAGFGSPNEIVTRKITKRFYLCGDGKSDIADNEGLLSSRVMLCAAHQAQTILRIIAGKYDA